MSAIKHYKILTLLMFMFASRRVNSSKIANDDGCLTNDGGYKCKSPFSYDGKEYYECTKAGGYKTHWCYDVSGSWDYCSNCKGKTCKDVFKRTYRGASCILYDDEDCDGNEGVKEMKQNEFLINPLGFDVESVSVRKGCYLNVYTGTRLTGATHQIFDSNADMHINMDANKKLKKFDDNVNSAFCICV